MRKRRWGDRYDGMRITKGDPINTIIPFIMKTRNDAQVLFDTEIDVSKVDELIRQKRKDGENCTFFDYILTALVRTISQYPRINRFIAGRRLYARNSIDISMAVKKELTKEAEETTIKFHFKPDITVDELAKQIREPILSNKGNDKEAKNSTDKLVRVSNKLPRFFYRFFIWIIETMDYYGVLPKTIHEISPFHTSIFVTNMGSIGAEPIYHHIYNFGTTSVFIAMGNRRKQRVIGKDGKIIERKIMKLRLVADERITDGYYLSIALKYFTTLLNKPEILELPPETIVEDDQV